MLNNDFLISYLKLIRGIPDQMNYMDSIVQPASGENMTSRPLKMNVIRSTNKPSSFGSKSMGFTIRLSIVIGNVIDSTLAAVVNQCPIMFPS